MYHSVIFQITTNHGLLPSATPISLLHLPISRSVQSAHTKMPGRFLRSGGSGTQIFRDSELKFDSSLSIFFLLVNAGSAGSTASTAGASLFLSAVHIPKCCGHKTCDDGNYRNCRCVHNSYPFSKYIFLSSPLARQSPCENIIP